jgi:HupE / UreJ protein
MMSFFLVYFRLGWQHITDYEGYDHMLFILALAAPYLWFSKRILLLLITAFTLGHSLTLAMAAWDIFRIDSDVVEMLIPITILITASLNVFATFTAIKIHPAWKYAITTFFGFIHGWGFSTFFREMITDTYDLTTALFAFNLGLEFGQILILSAIVALCWACHRWWGISARWLQIVCSTIAGLLAIHLIVS